MNVMEAKPMKILYVLGSAGRGGAEANIYDLVRHMADGFRNEFCFLSKKGPIGKELECKGFKVYYLPLTNLWTIPIVVLRLCCLLQSNHYDILYLSGLKANFLGRVLGRLSCHRRILGGLWSKYPSGIKKTWTLWLDRLTFRLSLGYVSNSQAAVDFLTTHGYDRRKFWLIHNGIDIEFFRKRDNEEQEKIRQHYGVPFDKSVITCVANLRPPKGHEYLIKALGELKSEGIDFLALLVGDGPLRGELEELVRELELKEKVHFLGSRDREEIPKILAITDIFVLPSLWEGLPTAIIEAMAAGCAVVASNTSGIPEIVVDKETGFLVPPRDAVELSEKIKILLGNKNIRVTMGKAGLNRARKYFSLEQMVKSYESLYREIVGY